MLWYFESIISRNIFRVFNPTYIYPVIMTGKQVRQLEYAEFAALSAELIEDSGGLRFRAQGRSMLPTIHSGDILTLEKIDASNLRIGDIVLIQNASNSLLAHRIITQNNGTWTTCGDALQMHDEPFTAEQLIGIVRSIEHDNVEKQLSSTHGRIMATVSRNSTTLAGRIIKRLLRR
jgi:signal peptidase I